MRRLLFGDVEVFDGERLLPGRHDLLVEGGRIARFRPAGSIAADAQRIAGGAILPGLVDAHVHLALSRAADVVGGGVTAALDLGAPPREAFAAHPPLRLRASGPIVTARGGYPTRSWGAGGFGLEVAGIGEAREAVARLADAGAAIVKVAIQGKPSLDGETLGAVVAEAHRRDRRVVAHALTVAAVEHVVAAGVDALAHGPVEALPDPLAGRLGARETVVVSTAHAFGAARTTIANLATLAQAGCRIVYGTDLGNEGIVPGAHPQELEILEDVLGTKEAALRAATTEAAAFAGFPDARIGEGAVANLILVERFDYESLRRPAAILIDGRSVS